MANSNYNNDLGKTTCNGSEMRRNPNELQLSSLNIMESSSNQNVSNLLLQNSQGSAANPLLGYQSTSFSGLYGSPGFNSPLTGYENNLQWLTDNRIQSNQLPGSLLSDKGISTTTHSLPPTTSHSCCVNRFGVLDSLGMGSPLPNEQVKSTCDVSSYQNKSNLAMNMIDPIQSWLNLQIPAQMSNNQQYCKYGERSVSQNYNIPVSTQSQINLSILDQSDLKQNDMCIPNPDTCFETVNTNPSNKHVNNINNSKQTLFHNENKLGMSQENSSMIKQQTSYQTSIMSKDWKSTFQSMQNYISSPNMISSMNESQENFLFTQYSMQPSNSYYSPSDNYSSFVTKNNTCMSQTKSVINRSESNTMQNSYIDQNQTKVYSNSQIQNTATPHYPPKQIKETGKVQPTIRSHENTRQINYNNSLSDCCQLKKPQGKAITLPVAVENNRYTLGDNGQDSNIGNQNSSLDRARPIENHNDKINFKSSEAVSSESDESNIIVEESDDIGEMESEISIEEIKKTYQTDERCSSDVLLRCLVCNSATSSNMPANQFIHMNDSFPLTTSSRTPVRTKLEQIVPMDLQHYLKLHNSFMCRRCFNLVETVELLEVKLTNTKQTISDYFSNTVQHLIPGDKVSPGENNVAVEAEIEKLSVENECSDHSKDATTSESEETPEFQCGYCCKVLSSRKTFDLHVQQHTKEFNFYCELCGKGFPLKSTLETHLKWHSGDVSEVKMLCDICGELFPNKRLFTFHMVKNHSVNLNFKCEICGKGFTRKVSLEIHKHKHARTRPFICEFCGHTFTTESNLRSHIKICTKDFAHECEVCGKGFVSENQLTKHESQHSGVYKLTCSECGKGFNKPSDLKYHVRSHSDDKQFKCSDCGKAFKTAYNLNYHSKMVHKEELFKCGVCGRRFPQQTLLSDHMKLHTEEKPYKCEQCDKSFAHQTTFITHLKKHKNKVKMKTCQVCGKSIKTRMSVHMRSHTGEKPYQCTYCPLAFTVGTTLKKHINAKHCQR